MTPQQKMKAKLSDAGIPYKEISVYGRQIMITAWSRDAAQKWASLIKNFARVRATWEGRDENKEPTEDSTVLRPATHTVWRVAAVIER